MLNKLPKLFALTFSLMSLAFGANAQFIVNEGQGIFVDGAEVLYLGMSRAEVVQLSGDEICGRNSFLFI